MIILILALLGAGYYFLVFSKNQTSNYSFTSTNSQKISELPSASPTTTVEDDLTALEKDLNSLDTSNNDFDQSINSL